MHTTTESRVPQTTGEFRLSKSKYLSGLQCYKRLYLQIHQPDLATPPDEATQALLDRGTELGELARRRFPGGALVRADRRRAADALKQTRALLDDPTIPAIFEGAIEFEHVLVRVDILQRVAILQNGSSAWRLIEVKSSGKVKDVHLDDLAVQAYVLAGAGVVLAESCLMHINTQYVYPGGDADLGQLFTIQDLTEAVVARQADVRARLPEMRASLSQSSAPAIEPDNHCHAPYDCPFWEHCTKDKPVRWIYHLPGENRSVRHLIKRGIETIDEIPAGVRLTGIQRRVKDNVEWVGPGLRPALESVQSPVHHLDFETFMHAIPRFPHTRPYQVIPMQWSNHIERPDGTVRHDEYLCADLQDPREALVGSLLESLGEEGSICVYSAYEQSILERLALALPAYKRDLERVIARLWDLFTVIRDHYYHPKFDGSFSIKAVLPAVVPSLGYADLEIREGIMAAQLYYHMVFEETDWVEKTRLHNALLAYCARDTLAMLELRKALWIRCQNNDPTPPTRVGT